jgi:integrase
MGKKRGHGEGTVYQYRGRWRAELTVGYRRHVREFDTRREALSWLAEVRLKADRGLLPEPSRVTVAEYLRHWLEAEGPSWRPATARTYQTLLEKHVIPALGGARLQALKPPDIQALYARLLKGGLSPTTVRLVHAALHRALSQAAAWGLIAFNPAERVKAPRPARREFRVLSPEEVRRLLEAVKAGAPDCYPMIATLVLTGMRLSEAVGLRWQDVDLEAGVIRVVRTLRWVGGRWVEGEPKTAAGRRQIPIPAELVSLLKEHRVAQLEARLRAGAGWSTEFGELVFPTRTGRPVLPGNLRVALARLCRAAGLEPIRVHDLRHTHATLLLAEGVNPRVVQERLGHSTVTMTLGLYSHVLPNLQREAAEKAGRAVFGGR